MYYTPPPKAICVIIDGGKVHYDYLETKSHKEGIKVSAKVEMRFLCSGDEIMYRKKSLWGDDDMNVNGETLSVINSIDPSDKTTTVTFTNGEWIGIADDEYEVRRVQSEEQSATQWGDIKSYHLEKSTLKELMKSKNRRKKIVEAKRNANKAVAAEKLKAALTAKYTSMAKKGKKKKDRH